MAGRFDFDSPGAAFVDTMAKVLAERKAEERQQMLDKLTMSAEERANRAETRAAEQARGENEWRRVQTENVKWNQENQEFDTLVKYLDPGKPLAGQATPKQIELLKKRAAVRERTVPQPSVSSSESFSAPEGMNYEVDAPDAEPWLGGFPQGGPAPTPAPAAPPPVSKPQAFFSGTSEYQQNERLKSSHGNVIVRLLSEKDPSKQALGEYFLQLADANNGIIPEEAFALLRNKPVFSFDHETGEFTELEGGVPSDTAPIINRTRPPKPTRTWFKGGTTKEGKTIYYNDAGEEILGPNIVGPDKSEDPTGIKVGVLNNLDLAGGAMMADPSDPTAINTYKLSAKRAVNSATQGNQKVKSWVSMFIENPVAATEHLLKNPLTPEEQADADMLLNAVGARDFKSILMAPTPKPEPPKQGGGWGGLSELLATLTKRE